MLSLHNICRTIGHFSLTDISFSIPRGAYLIVLGPTGCGKTILLETIAGTGRPDSGKIFIGGADFTRIPPEKRNIGFVYQRSMLFPNHTVRGNICYGMKLRRMSAEEQKRRVSALAEMLGIEHLLERGVQNLSGGESQKVAMARALAIEPPLLLLDEPLAPVDPPAREGLRKEILRLHKELGTTILHVEHDQVTARIMADTLAIMQNGSLKQFGNANDVFERPASEFIARFVGMENILHGQAYRDNGNTIVHLDNVKLISNVDVSGRVGACIAPEDIRIVRNGEKHINELVGRITDISDRGSLIKVGLMIGNQPLSMTIGRGEYESGHFSIGSDINVRIDPEKVHCYSQEGG